jgi:crotonobetainyl-CoA:carnitine CoA-transferase CaiB-like acyl-CoA transferase
VADRDDRRPLSGIRVLDLGRMFAAPWAGQVLGDLGAEVIKVEHPRGDEMRHYGPPFLKDGDGGELLESPYSLSANRNKRSIAIDIGKPEGVALVRSLALASDVLLENFKTGDLARRGLDYATLKAMKPELIYISITGFGQDGPYAGRPAVDTMGQAMSGMMSITGEPGGPPQKIGVVLIDLITGLYGAIAALAALRHREVNGGSGQTVDLALLDSAVAAMSHRATEYLMTGIAPGPRGSGSAGNVPAGNFPCKDGLICVQAGGDPQFRKLCRALGLEALIDDPRFRGRRDRARNEAELLEILHGIFRTRTTKDWFEALEAQGVFCAPIYDLEGCFADPQVQARGLRRPTPHGTAGAVDLIASPMRFSETPVQFDRAPPLVGEHTDEILREVLGYGDAEIERLRAGGVLG